MSWFCRRSHGWRSSPWSSSVDGLIPSLILWMKAPYWSSSVDESILSPIPWMKVFSLILFRRWFYSVAHPLDEDLLLYPLPSMSWSCRGSPLMQVFSWILRCWPFESPSSAASDPNLQSTRTEIPVFKHTRTEPTPDWNNPRLQRRKFEITWNSTTRCMWCRSPRRSSSDDVEDILAPFV